MNYAVKAVDELFERVAEECNEHHNALQSLIRKMQEEGLEVQTARNADHYGALVHHLSLIRNKRCLMAYVYNRAEVIRDLAWKVGLLHELPCEIKEKFSDSEEQYFKDHSKSLKMYMSQLSLDVNVVVLSELPVELEVEKKYCNGVFSEDFGYKYNRAEIIRDLAWKVGLLHELPCEIKEKFSDSEEQYFKDHSKSLKMYMSQLSLDVNVDMVPPKDPYIKVRVLEGLGSGIILSDKSANFASHSMHFLKRTDAEQYIARGLMEELIS
ncbi:hypothetical protein GOBAR_AA22979 [Gossypium barbadense]|uniref:Uncharacterized protein n=1 Tax=Gossypium barbadense TaxID=3634 RepID=A0A2P5X2X1_GOSBA|nr:hypothetical protein GOBAR_AA22979 [Gossypium barbadense]